MDEFLILDEKKLINECEKSPTKDQFYDDDLWLKKKKENILRIKFDKKN